MELIIVILRHVTIFIDLMVEIMMQLIIVPSEFTKNKFGELTKIIDRFQQENPSMFIFFTTIFICLAYVGIICFYTLEFEEGESNYAKEKE